HSSVHHRVLQTCPTRRSSDLGGLGRRGSGQFAQINPDLLEHLLVKAGLVFVRTRVAFEGDVASSGTLLVHVQVHALYAFSDVARSEEHTSELQSRENLVCRLL